MRERSIIDAKNESIILESIYILNTIFEVINKLVIFKNLV